MKVYCDTCVYRDLFEGRKDKWRDLGEFALSFFRQVKEKQCILVVSDWVIDEFKKYNDEKVLMEFLNNFEKESLLRIVRTKKDEEDAKSLSKENFPDALHVVLAIKACAAYIVTRNLQDFGEFKDLIEITLPESL